VRAALAGLLLACALCARGAPPGLLLEVELEPARVYVAGEARLRLRLLRLPGMPYGALRPPAFGEAAEVSARATVRRYELVRSGVTYQVIERTHAVVPRRAGRLVVPQAELERAMRSVGVEERDAGAARAAKRSIEVRPVPAGAGEPWLPARRMTLEESWSGDLEALAVGAPVTRTLVLRAAGLAAERLPRLEMAAQPRLLAHHDLPELVTEYLDTGIAGHRVQRIVLMPLDEGVIELPAVSVRWWDVGADAPRVASLERRSLRLGPAVLSEAPRGEPAGRSGRAVLRVFAAVITLLSVAVLWWYLRTQPQREVLRQLRAACRRNRASEARDALIVWWKLVAPGAPVPLVQRFGDGWDARARAQFGALDAALYARREWDGKAFWRGVRPWLRKRPARRAAPASPALPALFRLQARGACELEVVQAAGARKGIFG